MKERIIYRVDPGETLDDLVKKIRALSPGVYKCEFNNTIFEVDTRKSYSIYGAYHYAKEEKLNWYEWEDKETFKLYNSIISQLTNILKNNEEKKKVPADLIIELLYVIGTLYTHFLDLKVPNELKENLLEFLSEQGYQEASKEEEIYEGYNGSWMETQPKIPDFVLSQGKDVAERYVIGNFIRQLNKGRLKKSILTVIEDNKDLILPGYKEILEYIKEAIAKCKEKIEHKKLIIQTSPSIRLISNGEIDGRRIVELRDSDDNTVELDEKGNFVVAKQRNLIP
jgi:hypothetical protein